MLCKDSTRRPSMQQILESSALSSYILSLELPDRRPKSEETARKRQLRLKQEQSKSLAKLNCKSIIQSIEHSQLKKQLPKGLASRTSLDESENLYKTILKASANMSSCNGVASPTGLTDTCNSSDLSGTSDSLALSVSYTTEDFSPSIRSFQDERPIRASGRYDIEACIKDTASSDSEDEPYEDLQANTVNSTPFRSTLAQPSKTSSDYTQYEGRQAAMKSEFIKNLGTEDYKRVYHVHLRN